jgi:hypothetical protein
VILVGDVLPAVRAPGGVFEEFLSTEGTGNGRLVIGVAVEIIVEIVARFGIVFPVVVPVVVVAGIHRRTSVFPSTCGGL